MAPNKKPSVTTVVSLMGTLVGTFYCVMGTSFIDGWMETVTFELMRRYACVYRKIFFEIVSSELLASQY